MPIRFSSDEIRQKYDRFARWYDLAEGFSEWLGVRTLRRRLLAQARGQVLEVAVGTGKTLGYYPEACRLTALDLSHGMLLRARRRAAVRGRPVTLLVGDAARLPFPDHAFDTVVDCLTLCTFPDPVAVLGEMLRVCRPDGRLLLLEHGRSDRGWLGRWQDRRADRHAERLGCHWNREPLDLIKQAGVEPVTARRTFFGVFHAMEADVAWRTGAARHNRERAR